MLHSKLSRSTPLFRSFGRLLLAAALLATTVACSSGEESSTVNAEGAQTATPSASTAPPTPAVDAGALALPGVTVALPAGWQPETPDSPMRAAQATIPGPGGDGLLTVFFFGTGGGGSAQMNIDRWVDQIAAEPGTEPVVDSDTVGPNQEFQVSYVEHEGTLKASRMGTFPSTDQPGYALLGAVIEGPGGPWFFKAVGPRETLAAQKDAFRAMISSVQSADGA